MKIVISSFKESLDGTTDYAENTIREYFPEAEIAIRPFVDPDTFISDLQGADGLLTYFIPIDSYMLSHVPSLKTISIASTGYSNIDLTAAEDNKIKVSSIREYCTHEVADHTIALMLCLCRRILSYQESVKKNYQWDYASAGPIHRLSNQTLGIYGFGRIGQAVARRAKGFGINVIAYDPYVPQAIADEAGVTLVSSETIQNDATIISNHMNANAENTDFFNMSYFEKLKRQPVFINVSRGQSVDEDALLQALESGLVSQAGLDVFKSENPDLPAMPLVESSQTLVTPHAAFYSQEAIHDSDHLSVMNLIYSLKGEHDKVFAYVTKG